MEIKKVAGKNDKNKVFLYTLSTCAWCKMAKQYLKDKEVAYQFVDVDKCSEHDLRKIKEEILSKGGSLSYPVIVVNDEILINGFRKDRLKETLGV